MRDRLKALLENLCRSAEDERRFLRTLSLLEFMGARKIAKSVALHHPSAMVLEHWADETRHAAAFAQLAEAGTDEVPSYLAPEASKAYFQGVDAAVANKLGEAGVDDGTLAYLLTTTLVERRAMMLYPLLRAATSRDDVRREMSAIIAEEAAHKGPLEDAAKVRLAKHCGETLSLELFVAEEEALFRRWLERMEAPFVSTAPAAAPTRART